MTRQVLFIQGAGPRVHDEWDSALVASLRARLGSSYEVRYPRMPNEADPSFESWARAVERELASLRNDAVLVGHSVGGTVLIDTIAARPPYERFGAVILLAAPFLGEGGWPSPDGQPQRALGTVLAGAAPIHLFHGLADDSVPPSHAELYARAIPGATLHLLHGRDHQFGNDLSEVATTITGMAGNS